MAEIATPVYADNGSKATNTRGRHNLFGTLTMGATTKINGGGDNLVVGGMQAFTVEESNQTQFRPSAGTDHLEPVFGMRSWQGEGQRFQLRGNDLQQLIRKIYGPGTSIQDVDWRWMPFLWKYTYNFVLPLVSGTNTPSIETTTWQYMVVWVTRYRVSHIPGPNELITEDFSFIGKGYIKSDSKGSNGGIGGTEQNDKALIGSAPWIGK